MTISHKIIFIDSARFTASSLSNLDYDLAEGIHTIKSKVCDCFLEYEIVNENLIKHKCLFFNKSYSSEIDENLKKQFKNTFRFSDNDINTFILLLIKVYILMKICMIDKSLMIHHCQKKMISIVV